VGQISFSSIGAAGRKVAHLIAESDQRTPSNVRGIVTMLLAMAVFVSGDAIMKLMSSRLPTGETMLIRGIIAGALIWSLAYAAGALENFRTRVTRLIGIRSGCEMGAAVCFQNGLTRLPFADVSAILQINPLAVTAAAALFLGEKVGWRRWTATAVGLLGVLLIIRPGGSAYQWASVFLLVATCFSVARDLITRKLPAGTPILLLTCLSSTAVTLSSFGFLPFETWRWPSALDCLILAVPAVCMLAGQLLVVVSIRSGEVSAVVPFRYSSILWALLLSVLIWREWPDAITLLGIAIVTGAGLYTFHREQVRRREAAIAAANTPDRASTP
jgi:drug/metabolite transporter (DMT)-like permease